MKKISSITKEQEAAIPRYIQKWIDLASAPIDRTKVKDIFKKIYGEDKLIVFGESFQNTIDLIRVATEGKKLEYDSQLYSQFYSQLGSQFYSQLGSQLYSQLRSQLGSQLGSQLRSQLRSQLDSQNIKYSYYVSYYLYDWAGYYDYTESIGVEYDKESLKQYFDVLLNVPIVIFVGNVLFVCEKPTVRWNNGRLHSHQLPAIGWKDGTGFYYLNSVNFPKELWEKVVSGKMPFEEILAIEDIDQRTQAMRFGDVKEFIKIAKGELLDEHHKTRLDGTKVGYRLYKFPKGIEIKGRPLFTKDAYYMIYDDIVPGSDKWYMSGVPESKSVQDAMGWKFSISPEHWLELQPGLNMN